MPKRIPIQAAKDLSQKYNLTHVIMLLHDGERDHVITYGKTLNQCSQAAEFGNKLKMSMGWPDTLQAQPSRVKQLQMEIKRLKAALAAKEERDDSEKTAP